MFEIKYRVTEPNGTVHIVGKQQLKMFSKECTKESVYRNRIKVFVEDNDLEWLDKRLETLTMDRGELLRYIMADHDLINIIIERYKKYKKVVKEPNTVVSISGS